MIVVALALAAETPVDLRSRWDHDLFTAQAGTGAHYRVATPAPWDPPVRLDWSWEAAPDALVLRPGTPVRVPLPAGARTVYVLVAGAGGVDVEGVAADGRLRFADGGVQVLRWRVGEEVSPAWANLTGRWSEPVWVGTNPAGDRLGPSLLTVEVGRPDGPVELELTARPGGLGLHLLAVTTSDAPPVVPHGSPARVPFDGYRWQVDGTLDGLPGELPAARGPLRVEGRHFVDADGRVARLWGVNLVQGAAVPPAELAEVQARTLVSLGFNLVRLHHLDAEGLLLHPRRGEPGVPTWDPAALDRLDRFLAELERRGVYVALPTMTRRAFRAGEVSDPAGVPVGFKYVAPFRADWLAAEQAQLAAWWARVNPYTGRRALDAPNVAWLELKNESSLGWAWSVGALERLPRPHRDTLDAAWSAWLRARYGTDTRLAAAWAGGDRGGLLPGETLVLDSVAREPSSRARAELYPAQRAADLARFYAEAEARHLDALLAFVRGELGYRGPVVCDTSFGVPTAEALYERCDVVDVHVYWDGAPDLGSNQDWSLVARANGARPLEQLGACHAGKPCVLGELDHFFPSRFGHEAPLVWAALAARQDLAAVTWFAWSHDTFRPAPDGPVGALDLEGRTELLAQLRHAAALYRGGGVPVPAREAVRRWSSGAALRDLAEPAGAWLATTFDWRAYLDQVVRTAWDGAAAAVPAPVDRSPIAWDPAAGTFAVDTPELVARVGRAGDRAGVFGASWTGNAAVAAWALDGRPLGQSRDVWLAATGRTERAGTVRGPGPGVVVMGSGPVLQERLSGAVWLVMPGRPRAWALDGAGRPVAELRLRKEGGRWRLDLDGLESPWVRVSAG